MDNSIYIKRLKEGLKQKPNSRLFLSLAEELKKVDKVDEAIAILVEGIKKDPFPAARLTLGMCYLLKNMPDKAKAEFLGVIKESPENISAYKGLAEVYKLLGNAEDVARQYKRVLEINPIDKEAASYLNSIDINPIDYSMETPALPVPAGLKQGYVEEPKQKDIQKGTLSEIKSYESEIEKKFSVLVLVEQLVAEGQYEEALQAYDNILSSLEIGVKRTLQKKEEIKFLIKLIDRNKKELVIKRLDDLLKTIKIRFSISPL